MSNRIDHRRCGGVVLLALASLLTGCGRGPTVESFHPQEDVAKAALTTALTAWQNGLAKPGLIETEEPAVQLVDPAWVTGAKLISFAIVQDFPGESPRKFSVQLTLEGAAAPQETTYYVVGKDPLQVMNKSEYERDAGM
jgi:hypothetical protein